ncbi:MspA family porin [Rhodococcus sp. IEGM 1318]|uniref:MspA family porin n=1 Tax=Rhodococcus sp. IEGM 1318 TaxID=3082226 RepID=UPI002952C2BA|nr:MspA family porin [Rhodococcus sp. IEGM 1318]MDV8006856.1 MspA family porin [Rhodococcus sp. IEGM 1318]
MAITPLETTRTQAGKRRIGKAMCTCAAASFVLMAGSIAFTGAASATPTALPDKFASTATDDGWTLNLAATKLSANPVPNLATTAFTREGFVSAKVTGTLSGAGNSAVKTGYIEQGLQIGCQIDVSSGLGVGLGFSLGPSVGVSISGVPSANVGVNASVNPSIQTTIAPGTITTIPLGKKDLEAAKASITAENVHVKVDACMGPVTIRSYAQFAVSTATSDNSVFVYSDPTWL